MMATRALNVLASALVGMTLWLMAAPAQATMVLTPQGIADGFSLSVFVITETPWQGVGVPTGGRG